ncbi:hypothetical protein RND71_028907 [Anisodus tanguticus]|uniref:Hexosyltransferase n=1 Tax=Anisodus tanguticus TaxID=243964 RepID=A0AAE1RLL3_9SOLA|nr:hypothetical protein RND71_028907 [Anisodus tanguticus]
MKVIDFRYGFIFFLMFISCNWVIGAIKSQSSGEAYVTLLYGDEFLLGVRVLGKSIRDSGSTKDMVVLISDGVSQYANDLLRADGWIVEKISLLSNPNQVRPTRFWGVYTKLKVFNMTKYKKVVYLDADTIVVKSIDDLFKCGKFCANLKHSERLNSGVMVIEPSDEVFKDMMSKVTTLPSYTGGDQGFLNSYYVGFANAQVYEPNQPLDVLNSRKVPEMERLSTLYNADVGLYMLANKWMVDEKELRVIHYTLGPLKPWDWWTSWLLKPVDVWQNVRVRLQESLPGTGGGKNPRDELIPKVPAFLGGISICVCFAAALVSLGLSLVIIPRQVMPWTGLLLMYEWTFTLFFLQFGSYLHLVYQWGKAVANRAGQFRADPESLDHESGKGHQRQQSCCDVAACYYGLGMAFLAILTPVRFDGRRRPRFGVLHDICCRTSVD